MSKGTISVNAVAISDDWDFVNGDGILEVDAFHIRTLLVVFVFVVVVGDSSNSCDRTVDCVT